MQQKKKLSRAPPPPQQQIDEGGRIIAEVIPSRETGSEGRVGGGKRMEGGLWMVAVVVVHEKAGRRLRRSRRGPVPKRSEGGAKRV